MVERPPMTQEQIENTARDLTTKVEQNQNVSRELNQIPFDDRAKIAHQMEAYNAEDRGKDSSVPKVEVTYAKDSGGREHVMDMESVKDPNAWVFKGKTDVYDLPTAAQQKLLFTDGLKMTADTQDSDYLRDPDDHISRYHPQGS